MSLNTQGAHGPGGRGTQMGHMVSQGQGLAASPERDHQKGTHPGQRGRGATHLGLRVRGPGAARAG